MSTKSQKVAGVWIVRQTARSFVKTFVAITLLINISICHFYYHHGLAVASGGIW